MYGVDESSISIYEWLNFFSKKSNHWVFRYWGKYREGFFNRFMIIGDKRLLIIADKERGCVYEFKKPDKDFVMQINIESFI